MTLEWLFLVVTSSFPLLVSLLKERFFPLEAFLRHPPPLFQFFFRFSSKLAALRETFVGDWKELLPSGMFFPNPPALL